MTRQRSVGLALIIIGGVFIALTNRAGRSSTVGLVAGALLIVADLVRMVLASRAAPPAA